jgi:prepilin-type N-terminal cleavage/methylation domain-containing protein
MTARTLAPARSGYTLLEMVLAMAIGLLLLAGLYVALDTTLRQQRIGRTRAQQSALVRDLLGRIERDITCHLPPLDPKLNPQAVQLSSGTTSSSSSSSGTGSGGTGGASGAGGGGASGGGGGGASGAGGGAGGGGSGGMSGGTAASATGGLSYQAPNPTGPVVFNLQLQGDATQLSLYITRVPSEVFYNFNNTQNTQPSPVVSDLRRVTYWLAGAGGNPPLGLARQELQVATTYDALTLFDPGQVSEQDFVIAPEVLDLSFEYFDGTQWWDTWDGTVLQEDGVTPQGPPAAVAINLTIRRADAAKSDQGVSYRHVVALPTANNFITAATGSTTGGTTTGSTSSGSSTGGTVP